MVTLANRDYNYHDYHTDSYAGVWESYLVGENNMEGLGSQKKLFISKSTLIYATTAVNVKFNHSENVIIGLLANTWYEFKSNIRMVYYARQATSGTIYIYSEGVLPQEARTPE